MAESDVDFTLYAGRVSFPRTPDDLTDTTICPACLNRLTSSVCGVCTLDLNHPAAAELFQASTDAAAALEHRLSLIGRIRFETARLLEQQADARAAKVVSAATVQGSIPAAAPTPVITSGGSPSAHPAAPRRSSVQLVMLIVGVSLLSIAAIFFLVFAFITYGLLARSLIIGGITVAAFIVASVLRSRGLRSTAEGIAVFAAILVYLDVFAARANDLAGLGAAEGATYWGAALVGSAVAFVLWHRASGLRAPNIVGFAAFAPGIGLLVGGLAVDLATPTRYFASFAAAAVAGLAHPFARAKAAKTGPGSRTEGIIMLTASSLALLCGFFTAFAVQADAVWGAAIALAIVALIGFAHVLVTARTPSRQGAARVVAAVAASIGAVAAAMTGATVALRSGNADAVFFWPVVIAAAVALVLEAVARRAAGTGYSLAVFAATTSAASVAAVGLVISAGIGLVVTLTVAGSGYGNPWGFTAVGIPVAREPFSTIALAGFGTVVVLLTAFWAAAGLFRRRGAILLWASAALTVLAVPLLETLWLIVAVWLLLAAAALAMLLAPGRRMPLSRSLRLPSAVGGAVALVLAYSASWLSVDVWGWATLASIALLIGARFIRDAARPVPRAILLAVAAIVGLVGAAALASQLGLASRLSGNTTSWQSSVDALRFVGILAALLLAAAAVVPARSGTDARAVITSPERRTLFWIAAPTALVVSTAGAIALSGRPGPSPAGLLLPEHWTSLALGLALLGALLPWSVGPRAAVLRSERALAALAIAPVTYWMVDSFARVAQLPHDTRQATPIVAALLVAVGSLAVAVRASSTSPRWSRELGIAVVAVPGVLITALNRGELAWFVLLIAAVTALILSISADGLFASASPRRHLGWFAMALATAGLWWRLGSERVTAFEAYVLPLAGVLLLVSALIWNSARARASVSLAAPFVCLGGLLVAILPLAANSANGPVWRAYLIGAVSSLLLLTAAFVAGRAILRPYLDAAALAGALGVLVTGIGRAFFLVTGSGDSAPGGNTPGSTADTSLEFWLGTSFLALIAAAIGLARHNQDTNGKTTGSERRRRLAAGVLAVVAMTVVLGFEVASLTSTGLGLARAFVTLVLFLAVYLTGSLVHRAPFTPAVGWTGLGYAAAIALIAITVGAIRPIELGTVPVALALIAGGVVRLAERPEARSWSALGPGILVLLAPSLLATIDERPLWRLVGLGVVAVAVLVIGAVGRLQAPFVLGVVVALVHGIATFSSEIRVVYETLPGWLWLGIGGVLLIAIAARYEKRIKNLRDAAMMVASLR